MKNGIKTAILFTILIVSGNLVKAQWTQYGDTISGASGDQSGTSTSMNYDGQILIVGSPSHDGSVNSDIGQIKVYKYNGTNWLIKGTAIDGQGDGDYCGNDVDIDSTGNTIIVPSFNADGTNGTLSGQVRIFGWSGSAWIQKGNTLEGEAANDEFGTSVSISNNGDVIAIGARGNNSGMGHVRVFEWIGTAWVQKGNDIDGEAAGDKSGTAVSISANGNIVAIGALENDASGSDAGQVRVYEWSGTAWTQKGADIDGSAAFDNLGKAVSLSDDGSLFATKDQNGYVKVFEYSGTAWTQKGANIVGEDGGDQMDNTVSVCASGNKVAIGLPLNDSVAFNSGRLRIYEYTGATWTQLGVDIYGTYSSQFGYAVSLSGDGHEVASGAYFANGWAGYVNVYRDGTTTSLNTNQSDVRIKAYPNPTNGIITIEGKEIEKIEVLDITGKRILEMLDETNEAISIDLSAFNNGVYLLEVQTNLGVSVKKIVLE